MIRFPVDFNKVVNKAVARFVAEPDGRPVTESAKAVLVKWFDDHRGVIDNDKQSGALTDPTLEEAISQQLREASAVTTELAAAMQDNVELSSVLPPLEKVSDAGALIRMHKEKAPAEIAAGMIGAFAMVASMRRKCYYPLIGTVYC